MPALNCRHGFFVSLGFMRKTLAVLTLIALAACGKGSNDAAAPPSGGGGGAGKVHFLVLGDTGAATPLNTDQQGESANVAAVAKKVCDLRGCDFALLAGDNIYEMGAAAEVDPLFQVAFERPFAGLSFPFFLALGNHDNSNTFVGEGSNNFKGDAQVSYTSSPVNTSHKWNMPDRYYAQAWPAGSANPALEVFVLDSSPISHFFDDPNPLWSGTMLSDYIAAQKVFVQDALAASKAPWKFALAHHPYISNGNHGNAGNFDVGASQDPCSIAGPLASASCRGTDYKAFIEDTICGKVDVFFTGHDHNLYWLKPAAACAKTQHILSGAGSKARDTLDANRNPALYQEGGLFGFFWVELDGDTFRGAAYEVQAGGTPNAADGAGNPLPAFETTFSRQP